VLEGGTESGTKNNERIEKRNEPEEKKKKKRKKRNLVGAWTHRGFRKGYQCELRRPIQKVLAKGTALPLVEETIMGREGLSLSGQMRGGG